MNDYILEALERLPGRFADIRTPQDFIATEAGREHLDSISMVLLAVGERLPQRSPAMPKERSYNVEESLG